MTPTEATAILRQFNDWRRGHHDEQPDPREIGEAIDAAIEMIERLEAAEKERDALRSVIAEFQYGAAVANETIKALQAKIEAMEKQEPVGWLLDGDFYEVRQMSLYKDNEPLPGQTALYALPGAKGE